jgi:hypothetical protein
MTFSFKERFSNQFASEIGFQSMHAFFLPSWTCCDSVLTQYRSHPRSV